jgi:hypothetical protein
MIEKLRLEKIRAERASSETGKRVVSLDTGGGSRPTEQSDRRTEIADIMTEPPGGVRIRPEVPTRRRHC